eukprot:SAG25_NODE_21_length_22373_cov_13.904373_16_plen_221_part_00
MASQWRAPRIIQASRPDTHRRVVGDRRHRGVHRGVRGELDGGGGGVVPGHPTHRRSGLVERGVFVSVERSVFVSVERGVVVSVERGVFVSVERPITTRGLACQTDAVLSHSIPSRLSTPRGILRAEGHSPVVQNVGKSQPSQSFDHDYSGTEVVLEEGPGEAPWHVRLAEARGEEPARGVFHSTLVKTRSHVTGNPLQLYSCRLRFVIHNISWQEHAWHR